MYECFVRRAYISCTDRILLYFTFLTTLLSELNVKKIIAVIDETFVVEKSKSEKKSHACTGFEPLNSAIPLQCSNQLS